MKAKFSRQALLSGLSLTQNLAGGPGSLPILSNVLIDASKDGTFLIGTDLECFARVAVDAEVSEAGRVTAPAKTMAEIVRVLPDDTIELSTKGNQLTLKCNTNVYKLGTMGADDYPEWPETKAETTIQIKQSDLKRLLSNTLFAIPSRDPRKVLMGALIELKDGTLTCVATDGRKLGKSRTKDVKVTGTKDIQCIIPGRVLAEIERTLNEEDEIKIELSSQRSVFTLENLGVTYLSTLIEGKYPSYSSVIPDTFMKTIELPKNIVSDAIGRAAILAERKHHSIIMEFKENRIEIESESFEDGSYRGKLDIEYDDEPFKIAFNYHYLNDVFKVAPDATINMKVKDSSSPIVFECASDPDTLYLVMPVRIHELRGSEEESASRESVEV